MPDGGGTSSAFTQARQAFWVGPEKPSAPPGAGCLAAAHAVRMVPPRFPPGRVDAALGPEPRDGSCARPRGCRRGGKGVDRAAWPYGHSP